MSTLWLHIGHDKTGSSALQRALALRHPALAAQGIAYPLCRPHRVLARMGQAGTGNGDVLLGRRLPACAAGPRGVLFSHEGIFTALAEDFDTTVQQITRARAALGLERIKILLFIRNPVAHAGSLYQQEVRHRGLTEGADAYFARYTRCETVWQVLRRLQACGDMDVRVENYSHVKERLGAVMADWLDLGADVLATDTGARINRGCTSAELSALRHLNACAPQATPLAARALRLLRPHAHAARVVAGYAAQEQLWRNNADAMALVNRYYLQDPHCYRMVYAPPEAAAAPRSAQGHPAS